MTTARRHLALIITVLVGASSLAACGGGSSAESGNASKSVVLMLPGSRGDGGFFDQSIDGVEQGAKKAGWTAKIVEAGYEPTKWEPALEDVAGGDAGVIITGSFNMKETVEQTAAAHPDKKFVLYDVEADLKACGCKNIYSITYRYDQTGYLAGALAALIETSTTPIERINDDSLTIGVVGGQDIPVINDYIDGFKAGARSIDPKVKVLSAYAGSFDDPVKGKAIATDMIGQGADILFTAAGSTDQGVLEAAASGKAWALGNALMQSKKSKVNGREAVLTSSDTSTLSSLEDTVELAAKGELPVGETKDFGVAEGTNKIIDSPNYQRVVPAAIRQRVSTIQTQLGDGTLKTGLEK